MEETMFSDARGNATRVVLSLMKYREATTMKMTPPKGMNDILPDEMRLRDRVQGTILETYRRYGFVRIDTPALEDAENLTRSDGGDNLA